MIRTIKFVVDCKDEAEFVKIYLSIDDMWVEQVKSMSWSEGDTIIIPTKQSESSDITENFGKNRKYYVDYRFIVDAKDEHKAGTQVEALIAPATDKCWYTLDKIKEIEDASK